MVCFLTAGTGWCSLVFFRQAVRVTNATRLAKKRLLQTQVIIGTHSSSELRPSQTSWQTNTEWTRKTSSWAGKEYSSWNISMKHYFLANSSTSFYHPEFWKVMKKLGFLIEFEFLSWVFSFPPLVLSLFQLSLNRIFNHISSMNQWKTWLSSAWFCFITLFSW